VLRPLPGWGRNGVTSTELVSCQNSSPLSLFFSLYSLTCINFCTMSKPEFTLRTGIYLAIEPEKFKGSLAGKVALVTGSGRGIGREIAFALAKSGAAVAVSGRTKAEVDETTNEVLALGVKSIGLTADVCIRSDLERLVKDVFYTLPACQNVANLLRSQKASVLSTSSSAMRERTRLCHFI
jgi:hypothetical protein